MGHKLKHSVDKDFTVAPNEILKDKNLTFKAKGLWILILSLPEGWDFSIAGLAALSNDGRESVKGGLEELIENGYIVWNKVRDENGRFVVIVETMLPLKKDYSPRRVLPHGEKPHGILPHGEIDTIKNIYNKELTNKENKNNNLVEIQSIYDFYIESFESNKNQYKLTPLRVKKIKARLNDAGSEMLRQAIQNVASSDFHRGKNDRRWKADLDFIIRSYEQVEKLSNMDKGEKIIEFRI